MLYEVITTQQGGDICQGCQVVGPLLQPRNDFQQPLLHGHLNLFATTAMLGTVQAITENPAYGCIRMQDDFAGRIVV